MLALLGALFGFLQSLAPKGIELFQDAKDKKHELEIMQLQMAMQEKGISSKLEETRSANQMSEVVALQQSYMAELKAAGRQASKYSASVRPTVTYLAMGLYVVQKLLLVASVLFFPLPWITEAPLGQIANIIWTDFDEVLMSSIISFWFSSRALEMKYGKSK